MIFPAVEPDLNLLLLLGNAYVNWYYLHFWRSEHFASYKFVMTDFKQSMWLKAGVCSFPNSNLTSSFVAHCCWLLILHCTETDQLVTLCAINYNHDLALD